MNIVRPAQPAMDHLFEVLPASVVLWEIVPLIGRQDVMDILFKSGRGPGPLVVLFNASHYKMAGRHGNVPLLEALHSITHRHQRTSALHEAIENNQEEAFEWLLQHGASPGAKCSMAFRRAVKCGHLHLCRRLIESHKMCINPAARHNNALLQAAKLGHTDVCRWLLSLRNSRGRPMVDHTMNDWNIPRGASRWNAPSTTIVELFVDLMTPSEASRLLTQSLYDHSERFFWQVVLQKIPPLLPETSLNIIRYITSGFRYSRSVEWVKTALTLVKARPDCDAVFDQLLQHTLYSTSFYELIPPIVPYCTRPTVETALRQCLSIVHGGYHVVEMLACFAKGGADLAFDDNVLIHTAICHKWVNVVEFLLKLKQPAIDPFARGAEGIRRVITQMSDSNANIDIIRLIHNAGHDLTFDKQRLLESAIRARSPCVVTLLMLQRNGRYVFRVIPYHVKLAKHYGADRSLVNMLEQRLAV